MLREQSLAFESRILLIQHMDSLKTIFLLSGSFGVVGSILGALVARFGKNNDERLRVGNASGVGFLIGASMGALAGIFESMIDRVS